jgi:hypothetical protein
MGARHRRARTTTALMGAAALVLLCAACGGDPSDPPADPTNAAASTTASLDPPSPDDRPTVDPPGPFQGTKPGDDILITSAETLPDELVQRIEGIKVNGRKAVDDAEQFSLGQFSEENKVLDVAAVNPSTFRRFTDIDAEFQDEWDRIANGEVAVIDSLKDRIPLDDGYLGIATEHGTQPVHVGAWATYQVGAIDALVNTGWGERLGLPENNALLLNTGLTSPEAVRKQIEKFAPDLSITMLDIVAQTGIDPNTFQNVVPVGPFSEAVGTYRYTPTGDGHVSPDAAWVKDHIVTKTVPILGQVTCNKYMMPQLKAALAEVVKRHLEKYLYHYDGCYNPRFIAGTNTLSNHAFGLAIDLNAAQNQRGTVGQMNPEVVAIFKYWGFAWGGDWHYTDPMHFEVERIVNPG